MNQPTQEEDDAILTIRTVFDGVYPTHFFLKKRGGEGTPLMAHLSLLSAKVGRYEDVGEPTHDMY